MPPTKRFAATVRTDKHWIKWPVCNPLDDCNMGPASTILGCSGDAVNNQKKFSSVVLDRGMFREGQLQNLGPSLPSGTSARVWLLRRSSPHPNITMLACSGTTIPIRPVLPRPPGYRDPNHPGKILPGRPLPSKDISASFIPATGKDVNNELIEGSNWIQDSSSVQEQEIEGEDDVKTRVGIGLAGMKTGVLGAEVFCGGVTLKETESGEMPRCVMKILQWRHLKNAPTATAVLTTAFLLSEVTILVNELTMLIKIVALGAGSSSADSLLCVKHASFMIFNAYKTHILCLEEEDQRASFNSHKWVLV
ncbi:hypothetical protein NC652_032973 [Populus alba x Populus x berolinensis]|nr:hypothetical protein NC652_032973 [Populus alba x Populus x berolinensis]